MGAQVRVIVETGAPACRTTFRRSVIELGLAPGSPGFRAVFATVAALAGADELPGPGDDETTSDPVALLSVA